MTAFNYSALDSQGQEQQGILEADNARQIRDQLRQQKLIPLTVTPITNSNKQTTTPNKLNKKLKTQTLSSLTRQLATLLSAGLPLADCLATVAEQSEQPQIKQLITAIKTRVIEGHSLANALEQFPKAFPLIYRATIAAGENSGKLATVLERLADFTEQQHYTKQKIGQALIYPALMSIVSLSIVAFLLTYVVPRMIQVYTQTGQQLPFVTDVLLKISQLTQHYGIYALIIILGAIFGWRYLLRNNQNLRHKYHRFLLRLPIIGRASKTINTARFARSFGILFAATVPVIDAMLASNRLITLLPISDAVTLAISKVREGTNISSALKQTRYFPAMSINLIASGEASGQIEAMLERAAANQERDVSLLIDRTLTMFEPALILLMGAIVLFIVLAIMLPIFTLDQFAG